MNNESAVKELIKNGAATVTVLTGEAAKQLNPTNVVINGNISTPRRFLTARDGKYNKDKAHAIVNLNSGSIQVKIDETNPHDYYRIEGKIEVGKIFKDLGINTDKVYSTDQLSQKLRMLRSLFVRKDDHANIVSKLRNLVANINKEIEKEDDMKGNRTNIFRQKVQSNLPDVISLIMPIIEGEEPETFEVTIILEVGDSGNVVCKLESMDARESYDTKINELIKVETDYLEQHIAVIYS